MGLESLDSLSPTCSPAQRPQAEAICARLAGARTLEQDWGCLSLTLFCSCPVFLTLLNSGRHTPWAPREDKPEGGSDYSRQQSLGAHPCWSPTRGPSPSAPCCPAPHLSPSAGCGGSLRPPCLWPPSGPCDSAQPHGPPRAGPAFLMGCPPAPHSRPTCRTPSSVWLPPAGQACAMPRGRKRPPSCPMMPPELREDHQL